MYSCHKRLMVNDPVQFYTCTIRRVKVSFLLWGGLFNLFGQLAGFTSQSRNIYASLDLLWTKENQLCFIV